jgi:hypothetical protein
MSSAANQHRSQWVARRITRLQSAFTLSTADAALAAAQDYDAFHGGSDGICDACETVSHCSRHGCVPPKPRPSAWQAGHRAARCLWRIGAALAAAACLAVVLGGLQ